MTRLSAALIVAAVAVCTLTACHDEVRPESLGSACTAVVNDRIAAGVRLDSPAADVLAWTSAARDGRSAEQRPAELADRARRTADDIRASVDRLTGPAAPVDGGAQWLDSWLDTAAQWDRRAAAFDDGPDAVRSAWFGPQARPATGTEPPEPFTARDCRLVFAPPALGSLPDEFTRAAAVTCSAVVDDLTADRAARRGNAVMLDPFTTVLRGATPDVDDADRDALAAAADSWEAAADRFAAIEADPTTAERGFVVSVADYAALVRTRSDAVATDDPATIRAAFDDPAPPIDATPELADRDCRLMTTAAAAPLTPE